MEYTNIVISIMGLVLIIFFGYGIYDQTIKENECWSRAHVQSYIKECSYKQDIDMCKYNAKVLFCRKEKLMQKRKTDAEKEN